MTEAFDRRVDLVIGLPGESGRKYQTYGDTPTRIAAEIKLSSTKKPNKALVEVYNTKVDTVAYFQRPGSVLILRAGYRAASSVLVKGDVIEVDTAWKNQTRILKITVGDGELAYHTRDFNFFYDGAVTTLEIVNDIVSVMQLGRGYVDPDLKERRYSNGLCFFEPARSALDRVLADVGAEWSIQDGAIQILTSNAKPNGDRVQVLNKASGLLGADRVKGGVSIKSKLLGRVKPGSYLRVDGFGIRGDFVARTVAHKLDGYDAGSPFNTEVKAREIKR